MHRPPTGRTRVSRFTRGELTRTSYLTVTIVVTLLSLFSPDQRTPPLQLVADDKMFLCCAVEIKFYVIILLTDATIPFSLRKRPHDRIYQTKLDIYQNVLSYNPNAHQRRSLLTCVFYIYTTLLTVTQFLYIFIVCDCILSTTTIINQY